VVGQLRARRAASWRIPGGDPWFYEPPAAGYELAAEHLIDHGLLPAPNLSAMRSMWRAGGQSQRTARFIAERWEQAS
jgi:hypothetical protein